METQKYLIVILGPTASGKTALAVQVAKMLDTEIVSADSRQLYREMTIGTAKPTAEEMDGVVHHFINSHSIEEEYSIGKYEREALEVLNKIYQKKDVAVLTGGSGLYVKVVCEGIDEVPDTDAEIREELNETYRREGMSVLLRELEKADPLYYQQVDHGNPQRVIRGLEVFYATGIPFSHFRKGEKKERPFTTIKIGLLWERQELYARIDQRMDKMIAQGLFDEVKGLEKYKDKNALQTVGYKEVFDFFSGLYERDEAVRLLKRNTRRYAKRQMTWFNKDKEIVWMDARQPDRIVEFIKSSISN